MSGVRRQEFGALDSLDSHDSLDTFIRWATFCEKYEPEHCEIAAEIISRLAERNRR